MQVGQEACHPCPACTDDAPLPSALALLQVFAAVEAPVFGRVEGQLAAAREQARVAELKTGEAVQVRCAAEGRCATTGLGRFQCGQRWRASDVD